MIEELRKELGDVLENVPLSEHTTFKIGGPAKYFYIVKNSEELVMAIKVAERLEIPYFLLGWGSNLLVSDEGYDGLIIKTASEHYEINGNDIRAEAGLNLSRLIGIATQAGLSGLEFAAGIPGSVGGAACNNAGAYGASFGDVVKEVEIFENGRIKKIGPEQMGYSYRESRFKARPGVILSVTVRLTPAEQKAIQAKIIEFIKNRGSRLPLEPSAGCVFKNIELDKLEYDPARILKELEITEEEWQKATANGKLSVAYVIDKLGLKEKAIGGCKVSERHAAFFVNTGHCRAEHVIMLISDIKMRVRNRLGIQLQEEIQLLGF